MGTLGAPASIDRWHVKPRWVSASDNRGHDDFGRHTVSAAAASIIADAAQLSQRDAAVLEASEDKRGNI
jgi:hypothetical protein